MRNNVFVSFDYSKDSHYKYLLNAWDSHSRFKFKFADRSVKVPIKSDFAPVVKAGITKKMKEADLCLVIVGEETSRSEWVNWEIEKAKELGLKLVGVKINNKFLSPSNLLQSNVSWAKKFAKTEIIHALER